MPTPFSVKLAQELGMFRDDEEVFRKAFGDFFAREFDAHERDYQSGTRPFTEFWRRAADAGMVGVLLPVSVGGLGASEVYGVAAAYEMGRSTGYATIGSTLSTDICSGLLNHADDALRDELAPRVLAGAIQCLAMTEPDAGSNINGLKTKAVPDGDEWVISGAKCFITMGDIAELLYVVVRTGTERDLNELSIIVVDADTPGVTRKRMPMTGLPVTGLGEISFNEVRVPRGRLIGLPGSGLKMLASMLAVDRASMSAEALGQAEIAIEMSVEFARDREVMPGQMLIDMQNTRFTIADMMTEARAAGLVLRDAVDRIRAKSISGRDSAMCKNFVADASARILDRAVQLHGATGLAAEHPISHLYASNRKFRILAGTTELLKSSIAHGI